MLVKSWQAIPKGKGNHLVHRYERRKPTDPLLCPCGAGVSDPDLLRVIPDDDPRGRCPVAFPRAGSIFDPVERATKKVQDRIEAGQKVTVKEAAAVFLAEDERPVSEPDESAFESTPVPMPSAQDLLRLAQNGRHPSPTVPPAPPSVTPPRPASAASPPQAAHRAPAPAPATGKRVYLIRWRPRGLEGDDVFRAVVESSSEKEATRSLRALCAGPGAPEVEVLSVAEDVLHA